MIPLNEIIEKKSFYEKKYKLMGLSFNLDKIIKLENKFISIDKECNTKRAMCNKMCNSVAEKINSNENIREQIQQINKLDKQINKLSKKSNLAMSKINKILFKLPNPPTDDNLLNVPLETSKNADFTSISFENFATNDLKLIRFDGIEKEFLKHNKNIVLNSNDLPQIIQLKTRKNISSYIILDNTNSNDRLDEIINIFKNNAKFLVLKSIKQMKKESTKEILAKLCDKTEIHVDSIGEFYAREIGLKFYDPKLDMTKFINMLRITIIKL